MFHRAGLMSGAGNHLRTLDEAHRLTERFAGTLGIEATLEAFASCTPAQLVEVQQSIGPFGGADGGDVVSRFATTVKSGLRFGPLVDGDLLPVAPLEALQNGASRDVPVLVGTTAAEVTAMASFAGDLDDATVLGALEATGMTAADAASYRETYADESATKVLGRAMTDALFRVPAVRVAVARTGSPTFAYEFLWASPTGFGSVHCLDIPFVFDVLDADAVAVVAGDDPPRSLANDVHSAWVRFITDGEPGWPRYDTDNRRVMCFDAPRSSVVDDPHAAARNVFDGSR
jgi:carboxylesterase type B